MPAACRMASKTPPFPLMSLETEAPSQQSWPESKHLWGSRLGGKRVLLGELGSGVSVGTRPGSEASWGRSEMMGVISQKPPIL